MTWSYVPVASTARNANVSGSTAFVTVSVARNSRPFDVATEVYVPSGWAVTVSGSADQSPCFVRSDTSGQTVSADASVRDRTMYFGMAPTVDAREVRWSGSSS